MSTCTRLPARIALVTLGACLASSSAIAQTAPASAAKVRTPQFRLPQQVLPTGEEDARALRLATSSSAAAAAERAEARNLEAELRYMTSESTEGLVYDQRSDGTISVDLQGRFMSVAIATPTEDGGYLVSCHTGEDAVTHAMKAADIAAGKAPRLKVEPAVATTERPAVLEEK